MRHAEFKLFPWGLLALVMPALALVAAMGYDRSPQAHHPLMMSILLSTLGAGNAYILAIAGGRLSNAVLSIPAGAAMGFLAAPVLSWPPVYICYLMLLGLGCVGFIVEYLMNHGSEDLTSVLLLLLAGAICFAGLVVGGMFLGGAGLPVTSPWVVPICYPLVMSCVGGAMVVRNMATGAPDGMMTGFRGSVTGLVRAGLLLLPIFGTLLYIQGFALMTSNSALSLMVGYLMLCNYLTLSALLPQWQRVTDGIKRPLASKMEVEVIKAE